MENVPRGQPPVARETRNPAIMKQVRQLHLYLGTLFAPLIIFFALTSALQTFGLHEGPRGASSGVIAKMAEVHIHQRLAGPAEAKPPRPPGRAEGAEEHEGRGSGPPRKAPSQAFKWFIALMSIGLITTTLLGVWMAFKYNRDRRVVWALLALGTVLPIASLFL